MSAEFAKSVVQDLTSAGFIAYWAGGCVRDLLRGVTPNDYDVATNARPDQIRELFGHRRTLAVGEQFGVVIVLGARGSGESIEVATFRSEGEYLDGRRPESVSFTTPEEDAQRRDFTINGMFYDPLTDTVHDYVNGQADLQNRIIRAIGIPRQRMTEDKLRLMRAVRFAAAFEFELEPETALAVREMASQLRVVSVERIAQELRKMLGSRTRATAMRLTEELGLLSQIFPAVVRHSLEPKPERWSQLLKILDEIETSHFETALAVVLRDLPVEKQTSRKQPLTESASAVCRQLKLSNDEIDRVSWLTAHQSRLPLLMAEPISSLKRLAATPLWDELLKIEEATCKVEGGDLEVFDQLRQRLAAIPPDELNPPPLLNGNDLRKLGLQSGPDFKVWLHAVRDAQLNGEIATHEAALEFVSRLASGRVPPHR